VRTDDPRAIATVFSPDTPEGGAALTLGSDAAAHLRALRLDPGDEIRVADGRGTIAHATIRKVGKEIAQVDVGGVSSVDRGADVHLLVPVGDKDRMMWLAEKAVEVGLSSWRPVLWKRSRSVSTRGDGPAFHRRLHARMVSALEQSGNAWLPDVFPASDVERAIAAAPQGTRFVLDARGAQPFPTRATAPIVMVVGPEGGIEQDEMTMFEQAGFAAARIAANTLRFETAGIAALVLAQSALESGALGNE
jgi:16S rRNA (uracil1498-N3)-methyltransferase